MDLQGKFEKGAKSKTYQRIDADFKVNIFVGYNEDGCMSMVITENGVESHVKSTKLINVKMQRREDKKLALYFDLLDEAYKSMFLILCKDIVLTCEKAGPELAISNALMRWKYWKEMFGRKNNVLLDKSEIKGLIGELYELQNHFLKDYDEKTAVFSWMGPLLGHKDFEINDTWYEVKTVSENATQVIVNSIEQLESESDGHFVVIRLEETSAVNQKAITINKIVLSLIEQIKDIEVLNMFRTRLDNVGYEPHSEYDAFCFDYKSTQRYTITNDFPRLRRKNIDDSIGNVKYTILLNGISQFLED